MGSKVNPILLVSLLALNPASVVGQQVGSDVVPFEPSPLDVRTLATDSSGFLWIGTAHGLFRHEKTRLRRFVHDPEDPESLSADNVVSLAVDREGVIWVGTVDGLNRLDPETWSITRYVYDKEDPTSLPFKRVLSVFPDSENRIWVGTDLGAAMLDQEKGEFERYPPTTTEAAFVQKSVGSITQDASGRLWFGAWGGFGLSRFDEPTGSIQFFPILGPYYVDEVIEAVRAALPEAIAGLGGVGPSQDLTEAFSLAKPTDVLIVSAIEKLSPNPLDVGWIEDGVGTTIWSANDAPCRHGGGAIRNLLCIEAVTLAAGSYTVRYTSNRVHGYGTWHRAPPLEPDLWGISVLPAPPDSVTRLVAVEEVSPKSVPGNVLGLHTANDSVWIETSAGIVVFDPVTETIGSFEHSKTLGAVQGSERHLFVAGRVADGMYELITIDRGSRDLGRSSWRSNGELNDMHLAPDGDLWFAMHGEGLFVRPARPALFRLAGLPDPRSASCRDRVSLGEVEYVLTIGPHERVVRYDVEVTSAVKTREGLCWVGTNDGVYRIDGEQVTHYLPDPLGSGTIEGRQVNDIIQDRDGFVWAATTNDDRPGTWGGSVNRFKDGALRVFTVNRSEPGSLGGPIPVDFHEDAAGRLWVAHAGGFDEILDGGSEFRTFRTGFGTGIQVIGESPDGLLWMGDNEGNVITFDPSTEAIDMVRAGALQNWNRASAIQRDGHEAIWVAFENYGIVRFDLATGRQMSFTQREGLESTRFIRHASWLDDNGNLAFGTRDGVVVVDLSTLAGGSAFPPVIADVNNEPHGALSFRVLSSAYTSPTVLEVRISDVIDDWMEVQPGEAIEFQRRSAGEYTVEARESSISGTERTATARVRVTEPFWKTVWLRWLVVVSALGAAFAAFVWRERQRREVINVRRRIARNLHDEVGSQVAGIKLMADLARDTALPPESRVAEIDEIAHTAEDLVDALKEIAWFIDAGDNDIEDIVDRMRVYAKRHLRDILVAFDTSQEDISQYLPVRARREFILIFREAIRNCAQHSGATTVAIDLKLDEAFENLVLEIVDDGVGFTADANHNGLGFRSMSDRAKSLDGDLQVTSAPGKGTELTLTIPLETVQ